MKGHTSTREATNVAKTTSQETPTRGRETKGLGEIKTTRTRRGRAQRKEVKRQEEVMRSTKKIKKKRKQRRHQKEQRHQAVQQRTV